MRAMPTPRSSHLPLNFQNLALTSKTVVSPSSPSPDPSKALDELPLPSSPAPSPAELDASGADAAA